MSNHTYSITASITDTISFTRLVIHIHVYNAVWRDYGDAKYVYVTDGRVHRFNAMNESDHADMYKLAETLCVGMRAGVLTISDRGEVPDRHDDVLTKIMHYVCSMYDDAIYIEYERDMCRVRIGW